MIGNWLKTALGNLSRQKLHTVINIIGLTIGLVLFITSRLYIDFQNRYDNFVPGVERIYFLYSNFGPDAGVGVKSFPAVFSAVQPLLKDKVPAVDGSARLWSREFIVGIGERRFYQSVRFADAEFLDLVPLDFISSEGGAGLLAEPTSILISESQAMKLFGQLDVVGESLSLGTTHDFTVRGVFHDLPANSSVGVNSFSDSSLQYLASLEALKTLDGSEVAGDWSNLSSGNFTYVRLRAGAVAETLDAQLNALLKDAPEDGIQGLIAAIGAMPLTQYPQFVSGITGVPITLVIQILGALILFVAGLNYTNLAIAQSLGRAREVGLRKTMGARRWQLVTQFLAESILLAGVALVIAVGLVAAALPAINEAAKLGLSFTGAGNGALLATLLVTIFAVGVGAGLYPALVVSRVRPARVLAGGPAGHAGKGWLRTTMLVIQFAISVMLMVGAGVIERQNSLMREADVGADRNHVVVLNRLNPKKMGKRIDVLKQALLRIPGVSAVAAASQVPFEQSQSRSDVSRQRGKGGDKVQANRIAVDADFGRVYKRTFLAGRDLRADIPNDIFNRRAGPDTDKDSEAAPQPVANVLINAMTARRLGFESPATAIGAAIYEPSDAEKSTEYRIVGVVADINYLGFFNEMKPMIFWNDPGQRRTLSIAIAPDGIPATLAAIDAAWKDLLPDYPIKRQFLDETFQSTYKSFEIANLMIAIFAGLSVLVACIGLFGLAAFLVRQRTREIGIRRVLGASGRDIMRLMLFSFAKPVLIAIVVGTLVTWWLAGKYLSFFAERISLDPVLLLYPGVLVLVVAGITVAGHSLRAARIRPALTLRYE